MEDGPVNGAHGFLGLKGMWGQVANFGLAVLMAMLLTWMVTFEAPRIQSEFHKQLNADRDVFRQEIKAVRDSNETINREFSRGMAEQSRVLQGLSDEIRRAREKQQ